MSKNAALRSISACVSGSVSSDEDEAASEKSPSPSGESLSPSLPTLSSASSSDVARGSSSSKLFEPSLSDWLSSALSSSSAWISVSRLRFLVCEDSLRLAMISSTDIGS